MPRDRLAAHLDNADVFDAWFPEPMPARQGELKLAAARHDPPPGAAQVYGGRVPPSIAEQVAAEILAGGRRVQAIEGTLDFFCDPADPRAAERREANREVLRQLAPVTYSDVRMGPLQHYERALVSALFYCAICSHALQEPVHFGAGPQGDTRLCLNPECANYEQRLLIPPQPTHYLVCDGPASAWPRGASY